MKFGTKGHKLIKLNSISLPSSSNPVGSTYGTQKQSKEQHAKIAKEILKDDDSDSLSTDSGLSPTDMNKIGKKPI